MKKMNLLKHKSWDHLSNLFQNFPFSEFKVKVQNGVPVDAKKIKDKKKHKRKN